MAHEFETDITCPYCDYKYTDSWEVDFRESEETEIDCDSCGETFRVNRNVSVDYSTYKMECENHSFGETSVRQITQETVDRWNRQKFLGRQDHAPQDIYSRECKECDYTQTKAVIPGGKDPFLSVKIKS